MAVELRSDLFPRRPAVCAWAGSFAFPFAALLTKAPNRGSGCSTVGISANEADRLTNRPPDRATSSGFPFEGSMTNDVVFLVALLQSVEVIGALTLAGCIGGALYSYLFE